MGEKLYSEIVIYFLRDIFQFEDSVRKIFSSNVTCIKIKFIINVLTWVP